MKYILFPYIEYDTETKDLNTHLLCNESREYLKTLFNQSKTNADLDLPETINLQALLHTINADHKESNENNQKEKEILDNLMIFQYKAEEKYERLCLEMSVEHHNARKKKLLELFQQTKNQLKKRQKWTFNILIASSIMILFILTPAAAIFSNCFLTAGGWLLVLLALIIPNAILIRKNFLTSCQLDKLQQEIFTTAGILDNLHLKLKSNENDNPSVKQISSTASIASNSLSSLASQTSETSHTGTSTNKTRFGSLFTTVAIHQVQETTENLTSPSLFTVPKNDSLINQSKAEQVHTYSPIPQ